MVFSVQEHPDKIVVSVTEKRIVEEAQIQKIGQSLRDACTKAATSPKKVLVDFQKVQFMSSGMFSMLLQVNKFARDHAVDFRLANAGPHLREVFMITRITKMFKFEDDEPGESSCSTEKS